ncbi:MAG: DUF4159 domain-containing protein [Acidobacteria bacterium]|nr:DUF4159 domain-containing protein [Acidobacteriota bacterium]
MAHRNRWLLFITLGLAVAMLLAGAGWAWQHGTLFIPPEDDEPDTPDTEPPASQFEYAWTRLAYDSPGYLFGRNRNSWTTDYPKADRQFLQGVLRYTRLHARARENVVRPSESKWFDYPFVYAVEVGYMKLTDKEAAQMREYLLRGGFMVVDDFHGTQEWNNFETQMQKVFPDRAIQEVPVSDPIFHCLFDIEELFQVPGLQWLYSGSTSEKGGYDVHYRAIRDDDQRIMVMINFNQDLGDAWEWADLPQYPERYTSQAYRLGVNYIVYSLTH